MPEKRVANQNSETTGFGVFYFTLLSRLASLAVLISIFLCSANAHATDNLDRDRMRKILLKSRRLGAHGVGYNDLSFKEIAKKISAADIPVLLELYATPPEAPDRTAIRVGVQIAFASLCQDGVTAVVQSVKRGKMSDIDATESLDLVAQFDHCNEQSKAAATSSIVEIKKLREARGARLAEEKKNDQRIQENGLKMLVPQASQTLSKKEREEVFLRSVRAAGLDGQRTPEQENLYQRMYNTMVLQIRSAPEGSQ